MVKRQEKTKQNSVQFFPINDDDAKRENVLFFFFFFGRLFVTSLPVSWWFANTRWFALDDRFQLLLSYVFSRIMRTVLMAGNKACLITKIFAY